MNNIVPFQLPEASLTVLGWNLDLGYADIHYNRMALLQKGKEESAQARSFPKYCEALRGHLSMRK
jgi:hypothetical protein